MNPGYQNMGMPQMGMQMGQPQMAMGQAPMGQQHMGHLQMGQPQMVQQQLGQPQMGQQTPMAQRQMAHMNQPQTANPPGGVQQQIVAYLQSQQVPMGWQQTYRIENRLSYIFQIITQLNILRTDNPNPSPLNIAVEFERKQFEISPDQMTYDGKCREKLQQLTEARQTKQRGQQATPQNPQMNMGNQPMQNGGMFAPQPQVQQSQGYIQQPMANQNLIIQQQQQQAQRQAQMQMRVPNFPNGRNPSQQGPPLSNNLQITQQDQQQIEQMTQNMVNNMTQQSKMHLEQAIMNMAPHMRQSLQEKGTDLYRYMIRQKATQAYFQQKSRMNAQNTSTPATFPNQPPMGMQQGPQFEQLGNIDQIRRAQQDALHHQQEGQVVVPATGQRPAGPQRAPSRVQKTPQQAQQAAFAAGARPMQAPNQTPQQSQSGWNNAVPKPTPNVQQTPQMPQAQNFAQPQQNSLHARNPGLGTLNQPMNQPQNMPSPAPKQQTPHLGQRAPNGQLPQNQQPKPQANGPQRAVLPPAMQAHLDNLKTDEEKKAFFMMMRQRQQLQRQQQAQKGNMSQQAQSNPPQPSNVNVRPPMAAGQPNPSQANFINQQPAFRQPTLSEQQEKQMDNMAYPENILNADSILAQVPGDVKSWAQLKSWVGSNANRLPPDSLQKLKQLQAKHYNMKLNEIRKVNASRGMPNGGSAPAAQMYPNGNASQQPPKQPFPQVANPTIQEIQAFKNSLPKAQVMSDDQIRIAIMTRKNAVLNSVRQNPQMNAMQNRQLMQQQQQQYTNMLKAQQAAEQARIQGQKPAQPPQRVAQPARKSTDQTTKAPQQQGVKRTSNDDVVEVQDPKVIAQQQQQARQPPNHQLNGQLELAQQQLASLNRFSPAQINAMNPAQKAAYEGQRRALMAQINRNTLQHQSSNTYPQPNPGGDGSMADSNLRVKQLREEVMRTMGPRHAVPMSPQERGMIIQKLRDSKGQFIRITQSLSLYLSATHNEARIKDVIRTHALLSAQVRDIDHNPIENFTITLEDFRRAFDSLTQYMTDMTNIFQRLSKSNQQNKQAPQPQPQPQPQQPNNQTPATPHTQQLSAANLQQQQAALDKRRVASMKTNNNKAPAAPTTSHAPFPFGSQSPQGVPQIYVPKKNELTQEKLQLPVPKKQKKNQVQASSVAPASSPAKVESPEAQRLPATTIKCPAPDCKHPPFATKALLDKHTKDMHEIKDEQITDPLEYVLGGLRMALNLDEKGQLKPTEAKASTSKVSTPSNSVKGIKQEIAASPVSRLKTAPTKTSAPGSKDTAQSATDSWATATIPQYWFGEVFRDVADPNRALSNDFLASWLDAQPAPELSSSAHDDDSPQSVDKEGPSSHKSDISATDNIDITIVGEDGFLTENWFDISGDMNALEMAGLAGMEWEADVVEVETGGVGGKRAEGETSDEWLKVYAPEKYREKMKGEKKAVR